MSELDALLASREPPDEIEVEIDEAGSATCRVVVPYRPRVRLQRPGLVAAQRLRRRPRAPRRARRQRSRASPSDGDGPARAEPPRGTPPLGQLIEIPVADIHLGERIRRDPGDMGDLTRSIAEAGLLHPLVVDQATSCSRALGAWPRAGRWAGRRCRRR
jgi:hypothetical protein